MRKHTTALKPSPTPPYSSKHNRYCSDENSIVAFFGLRDCCMPVFDMPQRQLSASGHMRLE